MPITEIPYQAGGTVVIPSQINGMYSGLLCDPVISSLNIWRMSLCLVRTVQADIRTFFQTDAPSCSSRELRVGDCLDTCDDDLTRGQTITVDLSDPVNPELTWTLGGDPPTFEFGSINDLLAFKGRWYHNDDPGDVREFLTEPFRLIPGCDSVLGLTVTALANNRYKLDWEGAFLTWIERNIGTGWETLEVAYFGSDYTDTISTIGNDAPRYRIRRVCTIGLEVVFSGFTDQDGLNTNYQNQMRLPFSMQR